MASLKPNEVTFNISKNEKDAYTPPSRNTRELRRPSITLSREFSNLSRQSSTGLCDIVFGAIIL